MFIKTKKALVHGGDPWSQRMPVCPSYPKMVTSVDDHLAAQMGMVCQPPLGHLWALLISYVAEGSKIDLPLSEYRWDSCEHGHWPELAAYHHLAPIPFCWWAMHGGPDEIQFWGWFLWWVLQTHWCPYWWSGNLDIGMSFWFWRKARPAGVFQISYISAFPRRDWTVGARARNRSRSFHMLQHYDPFRLWSCGRTIGPSID